MWTYFCIFGTLLRAMGYKERLIKLLSEREKVETVAILRQLSKTSQSLGELKGIAKTIPIDSESVTCHLTR